LSATPTEQAHVDEEISIRTKRVPQLRHGATLQHCGHYCDRKDADRRIGGPRYPLSASRPKASVTQHDLHVSGEIVLVRFILVDRSQMNVVPRAG
jgi:hypothetical protein